MPQGTWQTTGGGGSSGGGGVVLVVIAAVVVIGAMGTGAVSSAADSAVHVVTDVLEVVAITVGVLVVLAVAAALTWAGLKVYRWQVRRRALVAPAVVQVPLQATVHAEVVSTDRQAIEAPKPRIDPAAVSRPGLVWRNR